TLMSKNRMRQYSGGSQLALRVPVVGRSSGPPRPPLPPLLAAPPSLALSAPAPGGLIPPPGDLPPPPIGLVPSAAEVAPCWPPPGPSARRSSGVTSVESCATSTETPFSLMAFTVSFSSLMLGLGYLRPSNCSGRR